MGPAASLRVCYRKGSGLCSVPTLLLAPGSRAVQFQTVEATTKTLSVRDTQHVLAAEGWLELGNHNEANAELAKVTLSNHAHPDVLEMRWRAYEAARQWPRCLELAENLTDVAPRRMSGWLKLAATLHAMGESEEACQVMVEVVDEFADKPLFLYNLACYSCQAGLLQEAVSWLEKGFKLDEKGELKKLALKDPMLDPLWKRVGK
jgi:tetratricopeptide (TPR) repeat protein